MHTRHAKFGNANALHRASRHTARLKRATMLCMHSQPAKHGNAMHCTVTTRHTARLKGVTVLCMHARLAGKRCTLRTTCGDSQMRTQRQCPQTPHGGISNTCCLSGTMHSAYTVWRQLDAHPDGGIPMAHQVGQPATFFWSSSTKR